MTSPGRAALRLISLATALLALRASSSADETQTATHRPVLRLQLQWQGQAQFAGFYVARALGFYEREGIEVEFLEGGISADGQAINPLAVLARGDADVAIAWLSTALLARRGGSDVVNIAQIFRRPATWLVCRRDAGIQRAADIRGKSIGVWNVGDQYDVAFWRRINGFTASDLSLVQQRPDAQDLIDGRIPCVTAMAYNEFRKIVSAGFAPAALFIVRFLPRPMRLTNGGCLKRCCASLIPPPHSVSSTSPSTGGASRS